MFLLRAAEPRNRYKYELRILLMRFNALHDQIMAASALLIALRFSQENITIIMSLVIYGIKKSL